MARRYTVVPRSIWRAPTFRALSVDAQLAELYLRSTPVGSALPGVVVAGVAVHADELSWDADRFQSALEELVAAGRAKADVKARLIWIPEALDDDPPAGPNTLTAWAKVWLEVPVCALKVDVWTAMQRYREQFPKLLPERFDELFPEPVAGLATPPAVLAVPEAPSFTTRPRKPAARPASLPYHFDFESVYQMYPRKQGRTRGFRFLPGKVKTEEEFQRLRSAVKRMAEGWRGATKEQLQFCPHWSTFVAQERWRDDELPMPKSNGAGGHRVADRGSWGDESGEESL